VHDDGCAHENVSCHHDNAHERERGHARVHADERVRGRRAWSTPFVDRGSCGPSGILKYQAKTPFKYCQ
jgi:hypothetical protein